MACVRTSCQRGWPDSRQGSFQGKLLVMGQKSPSGAACSVLCSELDGRRPLPPLCCAGEVGRCREQSDHGQVALHVQLECDRQVWRCTQHIQTGCVCVHVRAVRAAHTCVRAAACGITRSKRGCGGPQTAAEAASGQIEQGDLICGPG